MLQLARAVGNAAEKVRSSCRERFGEAQVYGLLLEIVEGRVKRLERELSP
jgi:hypothetical protein